MSGHTTHQHSAVTGPPGEVNGLSVVASRCKPARPGELTAQYWVICRRPGEETSRRYIVWAIAYDPGYQGGSWVAGNGRYDLTLERAGQVLAERAGIAPPSERYARAALTWLAEPGDPVLGALLRIVGPVHALAYIEAGHLPAEAAVPDQDRWMLGRRLERWRSRLCQVPGADQMARFEADAIRQVCPGDLEWPPGLDDLGDTTPVVLWVRGTADLGACAARSVAVVGARAATGYGAQIAGEMAGDLAGNSWMIVSGGAYGIDAAAHRGALLAGGTTTAVLASGVDRPYPAGHAALFDHIADRGLIISEQPPGSRPTRLRFRARNRIIAALTHGTVVVEAAQHSGALSAARYAADLGRPLMAVPGPVTSAQSAGCHQIIRDWGGTLVTASEDVLESLTVTPPASSPAASAGRAATQPRNQCSLLGPRQAFLTASQVALVRLRWRGPTPRRRLSVMPVSRSAERFGHVPGDNPRPPAVDVRREDSLTALRRQLEMR